MTSHIVRGFDADLDRLHEVIASMGGHAERMIANAVSALVRVDREAAAAVIASDAMLDDAQRELDDRAVATIARRQPMAADLREIIAAMRIAAELERIGDLAKSVAKRVPAVASVTRPQGYGHGMSAIAELVMLQLKSVLDAYAVRDPSRLRAMRDRDEEVDRLYTSLFRELLTHMMEDPRLITASTHLLFCAKNIERIGDHATNIAESVYLLATGQPMDPERLKGDESHAIGGAGR
ncbi:MAG: phosphate signaling complex protein PhoU [Rhizobiaceae bacterium]